MITFVAVVLVVGAAATAWLSLRNAKDNVEFYGLVLDEESQPVAGAVVTAEVLEAKTEPDSSRERVVGERKRLTSTTDVNGRFSLQVDGNRLTIVSVEKQGYRWLIDLLWAGYSAKEANLNYAFNDSKQRNYIPDASRPAVFRLLRDGATKLGGTSRGGADRYPDGRFVHNEMVIPALPSVGPGAPRSNMETLERMRQLLATRPSNPP